MAGGGAPRTQARRQCRQAWSHPRAHQKDHRARSDALTALVERLSTRHVQVVDPESELVPEKVLKDRRGKEAYLVQFYPTGDLCVSASRSHAA